MRNAAAPEPAQATSTTGVVASYGQQQPQYQSQQSPRSHDSLEPTTPAPSVMNEGVEDLHPCTSSGDDVLFHALDNWPSFPTGQPNLSEPLSLHDQRLSVLSGDPTPHTALYAQDPHSDIFPTAFFQVNPIQELTLPNPGLPPEESGGEAFDPFRPYSEMPLVSTLALGPLGGNESSFPAPAGPDGISEILSPTATGTGVSRSTSSLGDGTHGDAKAERPEFADGFILKPAHLCDNGSSEIHDLISVIRSYPRLMLRDDFWSPCIHHRLYRCSKSGMAEPLGIALVCVSSHVSAVASSNSFVRNMIDGQREKLVSEFNAIGGSPETSLAALHAMCIYQILDLLDFEPHGSDTRMKVGVGRGIRDGAARNGFVAAELHQSFLLKVRHLLPMKRPVGLLSRLLGRSR